jgi:uncharacterized membrane-anchored protein YhcB (DUF1043 family)
VFDKVIVITNRLALDRQLQKTIFQFDHTPGLVKGIDEDSTQLASALGDSTSKIIISTQQKYQLVLEKISANGEPGPKRYAVIIDEAHSSQEGSAAKGGARRERDYSGGGCDAGGVLRSARAAAEPVLLRVYGYAQVLDSAAVRPPQPGQGEPAQSR